jgi:hypothetical protein
VPQVQRAWLVQRRDRLRAQEPVLVGEQPVPPEQQASQAQRMDQRQVRGPALAPQGQRPAWPVRQMDRRPERKRVLVAAEQPVPPEQQASRARRTDRPLVRVPALAPEPPQPVWLVPQMDQLRGREPVVVAEQLERVLPEQQASRVRRMDRPLVREPAQVQQPERVPAEQQA